MQRRWKSGQQKGFTILELLVAISISMLVLGVSAGLAFYAISAEKKINRVAGKIEVAVRQAAMAASMRRSDVFLNLNARSIAGTGAKWELGNGTLLMSRPGRLGRWASPPSGGYAWKFGANGLSEPMRLKVVFAEGEVILDFDPLTGETRERNLTIFEK